MNVESNVVMEIEAQVRMLLRTRSVFPHVGSDAVGQVKAKTAPFYESHGFRVEFRFGEPLTQESVESINEVGHWTNENFLVRVYAILESNGIVNKNEQIKKDRPGYEEVDILRRLRHEITHAGGHYNPTDHRSKKLYTRIVTHFRLDHRTFHADSEERFPLPIDTVVMPLADACKKYVEARSDEANTDV